MFFVHMLVFLKVFILGVGLCFCGFGLLFVSSFLAVFVGFLLFALYRGLWLLLVFLAVFDWAVVVFLLGFIVEKHQRQGKTS